jgi:hypothetical protein
VLRCIQLLNGLRTAQQAGDSTGPRHETLVKQQPKPACLQIKVALCQLRVGADKDANLATARSAINEAATAGESGGRGPSPLLPATSQELCCLHPDILVSLHVAWWPSQLPYHHPTHRCAFIMPLRILRPLRPPCLPPIVAR